MNFALLFPVLATVAFYAVTVMLTGKAQDSGTGPVLLYLVFIMPGLLVALIDWLGVRTSAPVVPATTLVTYALSLLTIAALLGPSPQVLVLGLIWAMPAAACSWLVNKPDAATA